MLFLFSFFFFNCFFNNFWCVYSLVSLVYYLCTSLMPPSVFRAYEKFGTCKLCRFPCCLWNGAAYVNFLVQMMQLVHITSCSCIKMDCWKENIYLIAFSTCLWWIFLLFIYFYFLFLWGCRVVPIVQLHIYLDLSISGNFFFTLSFFWGNHYWSTTITSASA